MATHDPYMEVTCDGESCMENLHLEMHWYRSGYDIRDHDLEAMLQDDHDWAVIDGKHFCEDCKDDS